MTDDAPNNLTRRRLLVAGASLAATSLLPLSPALAASGPSVRKLSFRHLHTGETLTTTFWADGKFQPQGLGKLERLMRDWRNGAQHKIDEGLYQFLYALHRRMDTNSPFEIISAYRSPQTNDALRRVSTGVAKRSLHMEGMAIDVRLPDRQLAALRDKAWDLQLGGVGYYPKSDFIHLDTGRVRRWG